MDDVTQTIDEGLSDGEELETGEIEDGATIRVDVENGALAIGVERSAREPA